MHRIVSGLKWARPLAERPRNIPVGRPRGAKRAGVKYERDFAKALGPAAIHGQWFEFYDSNGHGVCQTDLLMRVGETLVVLECKYSYVEAAKSQIRRLYVPVLEAAYGARAVGVTVVKNLVPGMANVKISAGLEDAIRYSVTGPPGRESVLHWLAGPVFVGASPGPIERATPGGSDALALAALATL